MSSVLIVDDDDDLREMVTLKLRRSGFDVRGAATGDDAIREVARDAPDLVLLDLMMPGISGLEVLERWRSESATERLPVVVLTAKAQETDVERGLSLGADDYIVKPFRNSALVERVREILASSSA